MRNLVFIFLFLLPGSILYAQVESDSVQLTGIFDRLICDKYAEITVKTDLAYLVENKKTSDEYLEGTFSYETEEKVEHTLPVKIKCRGRYRRVKCDFPPLKLKFKKDDLADNGMNEFNELKLVTHCVNEKEKSRDLILREYATYKLYNILTPASFRVQLVRVTYVNTKKKPKKIKGWGILIEDSDELAHRMNGEKFEKMGVKPELFNAEQEKISSIFNFMVGNTDWSLQMARNVEFIKFSETDISAVSYDFDFAGLVDAPYAVPNSIIGQKNLQDRVYLGNETTLEELQPYFKYFLGKKEELLKTVDEFVMLGSESKEFMTAYLNDFFDIIENEEKAKLEFFPPPNTNGE